MTTHTVQAAIDVDRKRTLYHAALSIYCNRLLFSRFSKYNKQSNKTEIFKFIDSDKHIVF